MSSLINVIGGNLTLERILAKVIILFICLPIHEWAHAKMATRLGDTTAQRAGRVTLNPFAHLDLLGSILIIALGIGYAKPVPVNINNLRNPRRDSALISLVGPMSNFIQAFLFLLLGHTVTMVAGKYGFMGTDGISAVVSCLRYVAYINLGLTIFNLIPMPPLDGYRILLYFVPHNYLNRVVQLERYSNYILIGIFVVFSIMEMSPISYVTDQLFGISDDLSMLVMNL